jgi:hypothetical protein
MESSALSCGRAGISEAIVLGDRKEGPLQRSVRSRIPVKLSRGSHGNQSTAMDDSHSVCHLVGDTGLMSAEEDGHAPIRSFAQGVLDHPGVVRIEADHGFIDDEDFGIVE